MNGDEVLVIILTLMIFAGVGVLWMAMSNRRALREMEHRERLAMIQRGLMPAPETDPLGFEAQVEAYRPGGPRSERWRTAGVMSIGLGLSLMILLTFTAGEASIGLGIGGAFAVLGAAFLFNATQLGGASPPAARPYAPRPLTRPPEPPPEPPPSMTP